MPLSLRTALLCLIAAGWMTACGPPPEDPAVTAYQRYNGALRSGQSQALVETLTAESRQALARQLELPPEASAEQIGERLLIRPDWRQELVITEKPALEPVEGSPDTQRVIVRAGDRVIHDVTLRKEGEAWKVALPEGR